MPVPERILSTSSASRDGGYERGREADRAEQGQAGGGVLHQSRVPFVYDSPHTVRPYSMACVSKSPKAADTTRRPPRRQLASPTDPANVPESRLTRPDNPDSINPGEHRKESVYGGTGLDIY